MPVPASAPPSVPEERSVERGFAGREVETPAPREESEALTARLPAVAPHQEPAPDDVIELPLDRSSVFASRAVAGLGHGMLHAKGMGHQALRFCQWLDRSLDGRRRLALVVALSLSGVGFVLDWWDDAPGPGRISTVGALFFLYTLWVLVFGFLGSSVDDDGRFSWDIVVRKAGAWFRVQKEAFASDGSDDCVPTPPHVAYSDWAILFGLPSACIMGLANVGLLIAVVFGLEELGDGAATVGSFGLGILLCAVGLLIVSLLKRPAVQALLEGDKEAACGSALALPGLIDLADGVAPAVDDDFLSEVLIALASWKPRLLFSEEEYQESLGRHFKRRLPSREVEREKQVVPGERRRGRADFVISDSLIIETKRRFSGANEINRAIGQLNRYVRNTQDTPVLLVLFETTWAQVAYSQDTATLVDLHEQYPVLTVRMPVTKNWQYLNGERLA